MRMRNSTNRVMAAAALAALTALSLGVGCRTVSSPGAKARRSLTAPPMGPQGERREGERPTFAKNELESRSMEFLWDFFLGEGVKDMWVLDGSLYLYTLEKNLWAVDLADGRVIWKWQVPGGLSYPPGTYSYREDGLERAPELFVVAKDVLWVLDRNVGDPMWSVRLPFPASSAPAGSVSHVYLGSWDDRLYAISKDDRAVGWWYRTGGAITATTAVAERSREAIMVGSEDGIVYGMSPYVDQKKWSVKTLGGITAPLLNYKTYCYAVSRDMNVYKIKIEDGTLEWRYAAGAPLTQEPVAFGRDTLLVVAEDGRMLSLNPLPAARSEPLRWTATSIERFIAKGRHGVLVELPDGRLHLLADDTGAAKWDQPLVTGADVKAQNAYDPTSRVKDEARIGSLVVLGYKDGWVMAIREKRDF
jgi:outer membrane protein assembly factor BamB